MLSPVVVPRRIASTRRWMRWSFICFCVTIAVIFILHTSHYRPVTSMIHGDSLWRALTRSVVVAPPSFACNHVSLPSSHFLHKLSTSTLLLPKPIPSPASDDNNNRHEFHVSPNEPFCFRVYVPSMQNDTSVDRRKAWEKRQNNVQLANELVDIVPVSNASVDALRIRIGNGDIEIPLHLSPVVPSRAVDASTIDTEGRLYEAEVRIIDSGAWTLTTALVEYTDGMWNCETRHRIVDYSPHSITFPVDFGLNVLGNHAWQWQNHLKLPQCGRLQSDWSGRWVPRRLLHSNIDDSHHLKMVSDGTHTDSLIWLPYQCSLRVYTYEDIHKCFTKRTPTMHIYGDSNMRRSLKRMITNGQWCSDPEEMNEPLCQCEDYHEKFELFNAEKNENFILWNRNITIRNFKIEGILKAKWHYGLDPFPPLAVQQSPPNLLIISIVNWDVAFDSFANFKRHLQVMLSDFDDAYSHLKNLQVVLRSGQYFCCRKGANGRQFTTERLKMFNRYTCDQLRKLWPNLLYWDVESITEGRSHISQNEPECPSNHAPIPIVEVENQILANMLCN